MGISMSESERTVPVRPLPKQFNTFPEEAVEIPKESHSTIDVYKYER